MTTQASPPQKLRVVVVGGGVAALETMLALRDLAGERVAMTRARAESEFVYRPMTVREPFAYARRAALPAGPDRRRRRRRAGRRQARLGRPERADRAHRAADTELEYDALVLALGATHLPALQARAHDRRPAHGRDAARADPGRRGRLCRQHRVRRRPGRMAWPLPLYELALMTAGPRVRHGRRAARRRSSRPRTARWRSSARQVSEGVAALLDAKRDPHDHLGLRGDPRAAARSSINPGDRRLHVQRDRRAAGAVRPLGARPAGQRTRLHPRRPLRPRARLRARVRRRRRDRLPDQAGRRQLPAGRRRRRIDRGARRRRDRAAAVSPGDPRHAADHTTKPRYLTAQITGGHGFSSEFAREPPWSPVSKIAAKYLAPYLDAARSPAGRGMSRDQTLAAAPQQARAKAPQGALPRGRL